MPENDDALKKEVLALIDNALTHSWLISGRVRDILQAARGVVANDDGVVVDRLAKELAK